MLKVRRREVSLYVDWHTLLTMLALVILVFWFATFRFEGRPNERMTELYPYCLEIDRPCHRHGRFEDWGDDPLEGDKYVHHVHPL